jgi:hypothetical protein
MTERWRKKLGDLDKQGPTDDVFDLAKQGPRHTDEPLPAMRPSTRLATAVAAFAVFALAISVFVIPALRMQGTEAGSMSGGLFPLWPSQTTDQLQQLQSAADAGTASWALDPKGVATAFSKQVLGWQDVTVAVGSQSLCAVRWGVPYTGPSIPQSVSPSYPYGGTPPSAASTICTLPVSMAPGSSFPGLPAPFTGPAQEGASGTSSDGSFVTIYITDCAPSQPCNVIPLQSLTLYQPLEQGDGQIWAVLYAEDALIKLSTVAGQNVRSGASVSATFVGGGDLTPTLGYASCGSSAASSQHDDISGIGERISMEADLTVSANCAGSQPGYVWAARGSQSFADPSGGPNPDPVAGGAKVLGLTAVPVAMTFPDAATGEASPLSTTPGPTDVPIVYKQYKDPFGWSIDVPSGWNTRFVGPRSGGPGTYGAQFVGDTMSIQVSTEAPQLNSPPPGLTMPAHNDSSFPLDASSLLSGIEGGLGGQFYGDGLQYDVTVLSPPLPGPLSASDQAILDHMISSITFQTWSPGDVRNDWAAVPTPNSNVSWVHLEGYLYMLFRTSDGYRLYGSISCAGSPPSKTSTTSDGFAVLDCPDGSTWQMNASGSSGGGGQAATNDPPPEWPVATAHDGTLIAWILPGTFPPGTGGSSLSPTPSPTP